jgi:hypothetical protein
MDDQSYTYHKLPDGPPGSAEGGPAHEHEADLGSRERHEGPAQSEVCKTCGGSGLFDHQDDFPAGDPCRRFCSDCERGRQLFTRIDELMKYEKVELERMRDRPRTTPRRLVDSVDEMIHSPRVPSLEHARQAEEAPPSGPGSDPPSRPRGRPRASGSDDSARALRAAALLTGRLTRPPAVRQNRPGPMEGVRLVKKRK